MGSNPTTLTSPPINISSYLGATSKFDLQFFFFNLKSIIFVNKLDLENKSYTISNECRTEKIDLQIKYLICNC